MTKKKNTERDAFIAKAFIAKSEKRYQLALKKSSKAQLLHLILSALDCPSHFHKPKIKNAPKASFKNTDDFLSYGNHPIVLCSQCVDRMREALCLEEGEDCPSSGWRAEIKNGKENICS